MFREIDQLRDGIEDVMKASSSKFVHCCRPIKPDARRLAARRDRVRRAGSPLGVAAVCQPRRSCRPFRVGPSVTPFGPGVGPILNNAKELAERFERLERAAKRRSTLLPTPWLIFVSPPMTDEPCSKKCNPSWQMPAPVVREATAVSNLHRDTLPQLEAALGQDAGDELRAG